MQRLIDAFWRLAYRHGYPFARLLWRLTGGQAKGTMIAVWHDGRLLCVRESYRNGLGLPGGGLNPDETPLLGARRELREEVGLDLAEADFRERTLLRFTADGRTIEDTVFEVHLERAPPLEVDRREIVWAGFLPPAEITRADPQPMTRRYLAEIALPA